MGNLLRIFALLFGGSLAVSVTGLSISKQQSSVRVQSPVENPVVENDNSQPVVSSPTLPSDDSILFKSILSALGGVGGGGLLLIFMVKRFISNYDEMVKKWETRFEKLTEEYSQLTDTMWEKQDHLKEIIDNIRSTTQELQFEAEGLKEKMVTKEYCQMSKLDYTELKARLNSIEAKMSKCENLMAGK